nr:hypothetical protein [Ectobacillus panaciterrae]
MDLKEKTLSIIKNQSGIIKSVVQQSSPFCSGTQFLKKNVLFPKKV